MEFYSILVDAGDASEFAATSMTQEKRTGERLGCSNGCRAGEDWCYSCFSRRLSFFVYGLNEVIESVE